MKAGARRIRFKRNPHNLHAFVDNQVAARTLGARPVWYNVMSRVPMAAAPSPFLPSRAAVGQFVKESEAKSLAREQIQRAVDTRRRQHSLGNVLDRLLPPAIVFPEDEIRATFYAWHPFELRRPTSFVESESTFGPRDWSSIYGGAKGSFPLMGENVIQHTLFLMTSEGGLLSRHEAYAKAVKSFYEARIEEERIADAIQKKAMEAGAAVSAKTPSENVQGSSLPCPQTPLTATSRFVAMENAELLDGSEFTRALDEAKENKRAVNEKMSAFDQKSLSSVQQMGA